MLGTPCFDESLSWLFSARLWRAARLGPNLGDLRIQPKTISLDMLLLFQRHMGTASGASRISRSASSSAPATEEAVPGVACSGRGSR